MVAAAERAANAGILYGRGRQGGAAKPSQPGPRRRREKQGGRAGGALADQAAVAQAGLAAHAQCAAQPLQLVLQRTHVRVADGAGQRIG